MKVAQALWHVNARDSTIVETELPDAPVDTVELKGLYSLISTGTERLVALGKVPPSMHDKMKVPYMQGGFDFPILYGYSMIATYQNRIYHVMHPHQSILAVHPDALTPIPIDIPPYRATLISNMETACNAFWDAQLQKGEKVLVAGFGMIGALVAIWCKLKGFDHCTILESNDQRKALAASLGFEVVSNIEQLGEYNVAIHCAASSSSLQACINHLVFEGRVIDVSWYGVDKVDLELGAHFHYNRLRIQSSQVSNIPCYLQPGIDFKIRKQEVIHMLRHDCWDRLLTTQISLEEAVDWFAAIRKGPIDPISILIKY